MLSAAQRLTETESKEAVSMVANAETQAATSGAGAAEHRQQGQDAHTVHDAQFDSRDARVSDFVKDTGTDERFQVETGDRSTMGWLNAKRTYDLHQTLDTEGIVRQRRQEDEERQMRLRHAETEFNQRMENGKAEAEQRLRHYEDMHTMRYGVAGEMVEAIANRTAETVWSRCPWGKPKD